ncbi:FKBP-type peptidyl-prolyl cis-trans isomerase [Salinimonas marina]|uniref:Peptidyl-prolyl cis-trans isomerase n=1 Tax=Salinimonas marina TaxID=2785918 RepID=A0A7S9HDF7_9ALTE|nr:FKBP-type peptidyl-prolyl cis-trans isomerase [Salinimonas marina]QPG05521.1 FKBP-type peptidyl-prolyl cis-trans isomerase [Salinimonas marina]
MSNEIRIEDLIEGQGKTAVKGALITVHYRGFLDNGTEFDSSFAKGQPFKTVLSKNKLIQGWFLGMQGMQVGGRRKIWVPAELAYGERRIGDKIPPHSNLLFDVELLEVLTRDD